jgi:hypothetical protein
LTEVAAEPRRIRLAVPTAVAPSNRELAADRVRRFALARVVPGGGGSYCRLAGPPTRRQTAAVQGQRRWATVDVVHRGAATAHHHLGTLAGPASCACVPLDP